MTAILAAGQKQQAALSLHLEVAEHRTTSQISLPRPRSFHFYFFPHGRQIALVFLLRKHVVSCTAESDGLG